MKDHNRREIGNWESKSVDSYWVDLYIASSYEVAELECRKACFPSGLCVSIQKIKYIFGGGTEGGVKIGFIQYAPFPEDIDSIKSKAESLGMAIAEASYQFSFTLITPSDSIFFSRVK